MLFAGLVVHQHALLHGFGGEGAVNVFLVLNGELRGDFQGVVGVAAVAAGIACNQLQRIVVGGELEGAEAAVGIFKGAA